MAVVTSDDRIDVLVRVRELCNCRPQLGAFFLMSAFLDVKLHPLMLAIGPWPFGVSRLGGQQLLTTVAN